MKILYRLSLLTLTLFLLSINYTPQTSAQSDNSRNSRFSSEEYPVENSEPRGTGMSQSVEFKCNSVTVKVDQLIAKYQRNHERYQQIYNDIIVRVDSTLTELEAAGYETQSARNALSEFELEVVASTNGTNDLEESLELVKNSACRGDSSAVKSNLSDARLELKKMKEQFLSLKSSYQQNLKPELVALRERVRVQVDSGAEE